MSSRKREKQVGRKPVQKKKMNEALLFVLIIVVILGGILAYVLYKEREPSPISGISMSVYNMGMKAVDAIKSELMLKDAKERSSESSLTVDNPDYLALATFTNYSNGLYELTEEERNKKVSDNEAMFLDTIGLALSAQQLEANLIIMEWWAEEEPEILNLELGDFNQLPIIIDIYESIWKAGADAAASGNIDNMTNYIDVETAELSAELEPYEEFISTLLTFLSEALYTDTEGTDTNEILTNMEDYDDYFGLTE